MNTPRRRRPLPSSILLRSIQFGVLLSIGLSLGYVAQIVEWTVSITADALSNPLELTENLPQTTQYVDSEGNTLYEEFTDVNRHPIPLEKIPPVMVHAILAIEDRTFYQHRGISYTSILRAAYENYVRNAETLQGGSTLTQQIVKNTFLTSERTFDRKIKEMVMAWRLEHRYSKQELLEYYLNTVSFGGPAHGVEAASRMYFNKSTEELTLPEASLLAGLPASPTDFSPYTDIKQAKNRQWQVLTSLYGESYISYEEALAAYDEDLHIYPATTNITFPHFVFYSKQRVANILPKEIIDHGGLIISTTLNPSIQKSAEAIIADTTPALGQLRISNAAALITRSNTGEILGMVGSKGYYAQDIDGFVNITTSLRQPGSSVKPYTYAAYLQQGFTLSSLITDAKVSYPEPDGTTYTPENYDKRFHGTVTVRRALANSFNIPAVKTLEKVTVPTYLEFVKKLGIQSWNRTDYGLALTLGAAETKMTEMNTAYGVFVNGGKRVDLNPIHSIETAEGEILYYNPCTRTAESFSGKKVTYTPPPCGEAAIPAEVAFLITSVLTDHKARNEAFGVNNVLNLTGAGAKTGTTNDFRDNWTFGFNNEYTVGVWVGNNNNEPMDKVVSGVTGAAPIWRKVMEQLTPPEKQYRLEDHIPEGIHQVSICSGSDTLSCGSCGGFKEYYIKGTEPKRQCADPKPEETEEEEDEE